MTCSRSFAVRCSFVAVSAALGCGAPEPPRVQAVADVEVLVEPSLDAGVAATFGRFRIVGARPADLGALHLFAGEVGEYHVRRVRRQDIPQTLEDRRVPVWAYADSTTNDTMVLPGRLFDPGPHSLISEEHGLLSTFVVGDDASRATRRIWPPSGEVTASRHVVYCGDLLSPHVGQTVAFEPGPIIAEVTEIGRTAAGESCALIALSGDFRERQMLGPPVELGGAFLDPSPVQMGTGVTSNPVDCVFPEQPFGPGCATVQDDRILLRPPAAPMLWWLRVGASEIAHVAFGVGAPIVVGGLKPETRIEVNVLSLGLDGAEYRSQAAVGTTMSRAHVVIDEVLADALGREPDQEWVELMNDGQEAVNLGGWKIEDSAGRTELPPLDLEAGERMLVVAEHFTLPNEPDVPVPSDVTLARVPSIGGNGLSNGGERLRLRDAAGSVVSEFPAIAPPASGVSVCRFAPWSPDNDPSAFAEHASPGASPGGPCVWATR